MYITYFILFFHRFSVVLFTDVILGKYLMKKKTKFLEPNLAAYIPLNKICILYYVYDGLYCTFEPLVLALSNIFVTNFL